MNIAVTSYYLPPTDRIGAGVQMHMLANAYVDLGHDVTMITPRKRLEKSARYKLRSLDIVGSNQLLKWSVALSRLQYEFEFVHFSGDDFLVPSSRSFVHLRTFLGSCFAEARNTKSAREKVRMLYAGMTEVVSSKRADICTVISQDTNRYIFGNAEVVPCGVDLSVFSPGQGKSDVPSVLFVGTLDSRKRGRELVEAFSSNVRGKYPDAELWIVRDSSNLDVDGIRSFGSISEADLVELYRKAWLFCLPSKYEGFGVPYIEAMACGTCVVATPNPGALEVLDFGSYGVLTDISNLGNTLCDLFADEHSRLTYASAGYDRSKKYNIRAIAQQYIDLVSSSSKFTSR